MLNAKEQETYNYLKERIDDGIPPTCREVCSALGFSSTATANKYLNSLYEKGLIEKDLNHKRSIRLPKFKSINIPVINFDNYTDEFMNIENILGYITWVPNKDYKYPLFAFKSTSDYDDEIKAGDIVIAEKTFLEGTKYYIEEQNNKLHLTCTNTLKCKGRVISLIKYM